MYTALARQRGFEAQIRVTNSTRVGPSSANIAGILGSGSKAIHFVGFVFVLPPNPNGLWTLSDSHVFVNDASLTRQAETAKAVLASVRINFGAVAAQQSAIRRRFRAAGTDGRSARERPRRTRRHA
jgi:hypothetical protein